MSQNAARVLPLADQIQAATDAGLRRLAAGRRAHIAVLTFAHSVAQAPSEGFAAARVLGEELQAAGALLNVTCKDARSAKSVVSEPEGLEPVAEVTPIRAAVAASEPTLPVVTAADEAIARVEIVEEADGVRFQVLAGDFALATSGLFDDERRANRGADSFVRAAANREQLVTRQDSDSSWFFVVRARNNRTLWTSADFDSELGAEDAAAELHRVAARLVD